MRELMRRPASTFTIGALSRNNVVRSGCSVALLLAVVLLFSRSFGSQVSPSPPRLSSSTTPGIAQTDLLPSMDGEHVNSVEKGADVTRKTEALLLYTLASGSQYNATLVALNREHYASEFAGKVSYRVDVEKPGPPDEHAAWSKIRAFLRDYKEYEYIWILDADAMIMSRKSVLDLIARQGKHCDVIIARDGFGLNTGSSIWRTSPWSVQFMEQVLSLRNRTDIPDIAWNWEQAAVIYLLKDPANAPHACVVPQRELNAYPSHMTGGHGHFQPGDLVIHSPSQGFENLMSFLNKNKWQPL